MGVFFLTDLIFIETAGVVYAEEFIFKGMFNFRLIEGWDVFVLVNVFVQTPPFSPAEIGQEKYPHKSEYTPPLIETCR